jgi:hypothetical protein
MLKLRVRLQNSTINQLLNLQKYVAKYLIVSPWGHVTDQVQIHLKQQNLLKHDTGNTCTGLLPQRFFCNSFSE